MKIIPSQNKSSILDFHSAAIYIVFSTYMSHSNFERALSFPVASDDKFTIYLSCTKDEIFSPFFIPVSIAGTKPLKHQLLSEDALHALTKGNLEKF